MGTGSQQKRAKIFTLGPRPPPGKDTGNSQATTPGTAYMKYSSSSFLTMKPCMARHSMWLYEHLVTLYVEASPALTEWPTSGVSVKQRNSLPLPRCCLPVSLIGQHFCRCNTFYVVSIITSIGRIATDPYLETSPPRRTSYKAQPAEMRPLGADLPMRSIRWSEAQ